MSSPFLAFILTFLLGERISHLAQKYISSLFFGPSFQNFE